MVQNKIKKILHGSRDWVEACLSELNTLLDPSFCVAVNVKVIR